VLSGGIKGEVSSKILNLGEEMAEESIKWWKDHFNEDFYLEIMKHDQENENYLNPIIVDYSNKHEVKLVATNNTFYTSKDDANAHDILLCV
jgi:DNA polymerase-3 subunit alpha